MAKLWFIYTNNVVSGPFTTEQVHERIQSGACPRESFIWWKGQREWLSVTTWEQQLEKIVKADQSKSENPIWYVDQGQNPVGPLTENEMLETLRGNTDLSRVRLWSVGMAKWTNVFELPEVMDQMGISRREHERAPLMGQVAVTRTTDVPQTFMAAAGSVSISGMGLNGAHALKKGDEVQLVVKSHEFPQAMHFHGTVVYVTSQGYAGIKFSKVHPESQSLIFDYVKKFTQADTVKKTA